MCFIVLRESDVSEAATGEKGVCCESYTKHEQGNCGVVQFKFWRKGELLEIEQSTKTAPICADHSADVASV